MLVFPSFPFFSSRHRLIFPAISAMVIMSAMLFMALWQPVWAHSLHIDPLEGDRVQVSYDGGGFSRRTVVTVLDPIGHVMEEGRLDDEGIYAFGHLENPHTILVDDGLGHRAQWIVGTTQRRLHKWPVVGGMWVLFGGVAWFFHRRVHHKRSVIS
ncbi:MULTISPECIES: hypothetical protein [Anoxynatronum]|uniref:Uncharacterized protein n=2 Tax=Anoxynatronum TaxID=210622 RepID=A0AA45WVB6_9CLOT|nr:hypothetical protein [Anoxynatronum buryatiense]SMP51096.1 hypothetical protein SAMN06296020_10459 [Anoxynatronum buryatiense]